MELIQNRISQMRELAPVTKEHEETLDVIVPDVSPDVLDIVYTAGTCTVREKQVGPGTVTVSGDVFIKVFYTSEEAGRLYTVSGQIPYSYNYEATGAQAGDRAVVCARILNAGAFMLNPRKLTLKAELGVDLRLFQPTVLEIVEEAAGSAEEGIQTRTVGDTWSYLGDIPEKKIAFNEEIRLMTGNIGENDRLVRSDLAWVGEDVKVLPGKVMVRGNALVKVVTLPEGGRTAMENTYKLPFSQIIESDSICAEDMVDIDFQTLQYDTQLVTRGENELYLYCNIFGNAACMVKKQSDVKLLEDMYSTAYDMRYDMAEVSGNMNEPGQVTAEAGTLIELECPAAQIYDYSWCGRGRTTQSSVLGSFYFKVLYENTDGKLCSASRRIDVEAPAENLCSGCCAKAMAEAVSVSIDTAGCIQITFKAVFEAPCVSAPPRRYIKSAQLNTEQTLGRIRDASLVLRATQEGESVWSIAKEYRTAPSAILSANKMAAEGELKPGKLVIIPFVQ